MIEMKTNKKYKNSYFLCFCVNVLKLCVKIKIGNHFLLISGITLFFISSSQELMVTLVERFCRIHGCPINSRQLGRMCGSTCKHFSTKEENFSE